MLGIKDKQTVTSNGNKIVESAIDGVQIIPLNNILTRSGLMTEVFRSDWFQPVDIKQVNWVELTPNGITDWHCHALQTDRLVGVAGTIKLCLYDARPKSLTKGASEVIRFGQAAPRMVVLPPGVWHGLRNECGAPAGYLNVIDKLYVHENPDNFRLPFDSTKIPVTL